MPSEDITFCCKSNCSNTRCERNPKNIKQYWLDHSYAMFTDCPYWDTFTEDNYDQKRYAIKKLH